MRRLPMKLQHSDLTGHAALIEPFLPFDLNIYTPVARFTKT